MIRVLVVDDHAVVRAGICRLLEAEPDIDVIGQTGAGREAVRLCQKLKPDVIVLDYDPPTPLETGNFGGHLIFGLTGWMVETVIIDGRVVMKDRELTTVDSREIEARARERARDLWRRM